MVYRKDWGQPQQGSQGFARTMKAYGRKVNISATDLTVLNNVVGCFMVPAGFVLLGVYAPAVPDLDTGTTLTISLGDATNPARLLAASTIGQAGGAFPALAAGAQFFRFTADTEIILTAAAAATGGAAGVLELYLFGFIF